LERNNEISEPTATDPSIFEGEKSTMTFSSASSPQNSSARQGESKEEEIVSARFPEVKEEVQSKMEKKSGL
jgi:hypothetical protein